MLGVETPSDLPGGICPGPRLSASSRRAGQEVSVLRMRVRGAPTPRPRGAGSWAEPEPVTAPPAPAAWGSVFRRGAPHELAQKSPGGPFTGPVSGQPSPLAKANLAGGCAGARGPWNRV